MLLLVHVCVQRVCYSSECNYNNYAATEDLLLLATAKSEKHKRKTIITELVVVWSLCSV